MMWPIFEGETVRPGRDCFCDAHGEWTRRKEGKEVGDLPYLIPQDRDADGNRVWGQPKFADLK